MISIEHAIYQLNEYLYNFSRAQKSDSLLYCINIIPMYLCHKAIHAKINTILYVCALIFIGYHVLKIISLKALIIYKKVHKVKV